MRKRDDDRHVAFILNFNGALPTEFLLGKFHLAGNIISEQRETLTEVDGANTCIIEVALDDLDGGISEFFWLVGGDRDL